MKKCFSALIIVILLVASVSCSVSAGSDLFSSASRLVDTYNSSISTFFTTLGLNPLTALSISSDLKLNKTGNNHYSTSDGYFTLQYSPQEITIRASLDDDSQYKNIPMFIIAQAIYTIDFFSTDFETLLYWVNDAQNAAREYHSTNYSIYASTIPNISLTFRIVPTN